MKYFVYLMEIIAQTWLRGNGLYNMSGLINIAIDILTR